MIKFDYVPIGISRISIQYIYFIYHIRDPPPPQYNYYYRRYKIIVYIFCMSYLHA